MTNRTGHFQFVQNDLRSLLRCTKNLATPNQRFMHLDCKNIGHGTKLLQKIEPAQKAIASALKLRPDDEINRNLDQIIREVVDEKRDQPRTMSDLTG